LESIAKNDFITKKYEIILVNNNSTDNSEEECFRFRQNFPGVNFHYFIETAQGLSFARNRGITEAKRDLLVFLDDDSFVSSDYLVNLEKHIHNYPDMVAFGGEISPLFETGIAPKWFSKWTYSWVSAINLGEKITLFKGNSFPIGANMGFKKKKKKKHGTFNTSLGRNKKNLMGGEEKDIFNRSNRKIEKIYYFPDLKVMHVIPENRTTLEYIKKLGEGIGMSEKLRTLNVSNTKYYRRLVSELIKWVASIVLFIGYTIVIEPQKGIVLILFRWKVTKGLL
jgi:glycosyltransferase involved in cell wall biosynthesis